MVKRNYVIIATGLAIVITFLCGYNKSGGNYVTPDEAALQQSQEIIEAVVNKDTEVLKEMFYEHTKSTHDLDREIANFFEFTDGEIVSYDTPSGGVDYLKILTLMMKKQAILMKVFQQ